MTSLLKRLTLFLSSRHSLYGTVALRRPFSSTIDHTTIGIPEIEEPVQEDAIKIEEKLASDDATETFNLNEPKKFKYNQESLSLLKYVPFFVKTIITLSLTCWSSNLS